jgi:hypothetical protein
MKLPMMALGLCVLLGLSPIARADDEPDPYEDFYGTSGINTWTSAADSKLFSDDPATATLFDTHVDDFLLQVGHDTPFSNLVYEFDHSAFSMDPLGLAYYADGGAPLNTAGDLALSADFALFSGPDGPLTGSELWAFLTDNLGTIANWEVLGLLTLAPFVILADGLLGLSG